MSVPIDALKNWTKLNKWLLTAKEDDVWEALEEEKKRPRLQFLIRIYGRANKLRTQRERLGLVSVK